ncbi:hypothetical protein GCM10010198_14280 [Nocardia seriolae]|nr:hypothetical protein NSERKGN1266_10170 [Nocardia seriolae]BEK99091.1 hypothetical protein NSER024013_69970 [Nocardia seriolae]
MAAPVDIRPKATEAAAPTPAIRAVRRKPAVRFSLIVPSSVFLRTTPTTGAEEGRYGTEFHTSNVPARDSNSIEP